MPTQLVSTISGVTGYASNALARSVQMVRSDVPNNMPGSQFFGNPNEVNQGRTR